MALGVIGAGAAFLTVPGLITSFDLELADLARLQRGTCPGVVFLLVQEMPDQDGERALRRDGGHMLPPLRPDPQKESA